MTTLHLIDAFALVYRSYYANPNLTNGAAFFFAKAVQGLIFQEEPTHLATVFDVERGSRYRYALHPNYKAGRNERPAVLDVQLPLVKEVVQTQGWNPVEVPGAEADDVLATLASRARFRGFDKVVVISPDKDLLQLVDDARGISVLAQRERSWIHTEADGVKARLGVSPDQVVDYLTLVGDISDNVPGVPGIGEKGAAGLLEKYGTLEGVLAHLKSLKKTYREGIEASLAQIPVSRRLVTVVRNLDMAFPDTAIKNPNTEELRAFYKRIGFPTLMPDPSMDELVRRGLDETTFDDVEGF